MSSSKFKNFLAFYVFLSLISLGCSKRNIQQTSFTESYLEDIRDTSRIAVNFSLNKDSLLQLLNDYIDVKFKEDIALSKFDAKIQIQRFGSLNLEVQDSIILFEVPLDISIQKQTYFGNVNAQGTILFVISSDLIIDNRWSLTTKSKLLYHQWIIKPVFNIGVNIPIKYLSDQLIKILQDDILSDIDKQIQETVELRSMIENGVGYISSPFQLDSNLNTWFQMVVYKISLSSVYTDKSNIYGQLIVFTNNKIITNQEIDKNKNVPVFNWESTTMDSSNISISFDLKNRFIGDQLNQVYKGKRFLEKGKELILDTMIVSTLHGKTKVRTKVHGDYNGWIEVTGFPYYNHKDRTVTAKSIEIKVLTKNVLIKGLSWILKGKMRRDLSKLLTISLDDYILQLQDKLDSELSNINSKNDVYLYLKIGDYKVKHLKTYDKGVFGVINFNSYISSHLNMRIQ